MTLALHLHDVLDDPDAVREAVRVQGGHWDQARYVPVAAAAAARPGHPLVGPDGAPPLFRSDWYAWGSPSGLGEHLADHQVLHHAARRLHDGAITMPVEIHVNLNLPGPVYDTGHLDVPVLRGRDRRNTPGWVLLALARSGLADRWWVRTATAVLWLHRGRGGAFTWWPDGVDGPAATVSDLWNRAIVLDADRLMHRVGRVGAGAGPATRLARDARVEPGDGTTWRLHPGDGEPPVDLDDALVRVSISWKALVFDDAAERDAYARGDDALDLATATDLLRATVRRRGGSLGDDVALDTPEFAAAVERWLPRPVPLTVPVEDRP